MPLPPADQPFHPQHPALRPFCRAPNLQPPADSVVALVYGSCCIQVFGGRGWEAESTCWVNRYKQVPILQLDQEDRTQNLNFAPLPHIVPRSPSALQLDFSSTTY
jgi:hypothetical protein